MKTLSLYLGHPFESRKEVRKWELMFERRTGIELINPFYDVKDRTDIKRIDSGEKGMDEDIDEIKIVQNDISKIEKSQGLIIIIDGKKSYGTIQEMVYAFLFNKPVYSLITNGYEEHPWLKYHSTKIFTKRKNLEDFLIGLKK